MHEVSFRGMCTWCIYADDFSRTPILFLQAETWKELLE